MSCSLISNKERNNNINSAKRIINNVDSLMIMLDDTNFVSYSFHMGVKSSKYLMIKRLQDHLIKNRFKESNKFEKESIQRTEFHNIHYIVNKIKFRSNITQDIVWFYFENYPDSTRWVFDGYSFCNNIEAESSKYEIPCDKQ